MNFRQCGGMAAHLDNELGDRCYVLSLKGNYRIYFYSREVKNERTERFIFQFFHFSFSREGDCTDSLLNFILC